MRKILLSLILSACVFLIADSLFAGVNEDLIKSSAKNDAELAKISIEKGADVNLQDKNGYTPLMIASNFGHIDIVTLLVEKGADIHIQANNGETALSLAEKKGHEKVINFFKNIADNKTNKAAGQPSKPESAEGANPPQKEPVKKAAALTPEKQAEINDQMIKAARDGYTEEVKEFIKQGANLNYQDEESNTALFFAINQNLKELTDFLITGGANLNLKNKSGMTALLYAAKMGNAPLYEKLASLGADAGAADNEGRSAIVYAVISANIDMVKALAEKGTGLNAKDNKDNTLLHYSIKSGKREISKYLIEKGADVNSRNSEGRSALYYAVKSEDADIAKLLIEKMSGFKDINEKDKDGKTLLANCCECKKDFDEICRLLISKGADAKGTKYDDSKVPGPLKEIMNKMSVNAIYSIDYNELIRANDNSGVVTLKKCGKCGKLSPGYFTIGDRCPHCGLSWAADGAPKADPASALWRRNVGKAYFKDEKHYRIDMKIDAEEGLESITVANGNDAWFYLKNTGQTTTIPVPPLAAHRMNLMTRFEEGKSDGGVTYTYYPDAASKEHETAAIDPVKKLLTGRNIYDKNEELTGEMKYTELTFGTIEDSLFQKPVKTPEEKK
ncbi:MAG: Phosphocholine transferase AnkX [bacterium ADurb.Bin243]|nr:MAG: Phosphocholine transferase AnkX [bacterium ADurb.Bin243]HOD39376.1 ankyrin repeat domain-containing protein [Candidatus Wallbacteria bacterium]